MFKSQSVCIILKQIILIVRSARKEWTRIRGILVGKARRLSLFPDSEFPVEVALPV